MEADIAREYVVTKDIPANLLDGTVQDFFSEQRMTFDVIRSERSFFELRPQENVYRCISRIFGVKRDG